MKLGKGDSPCGVASKRMALLPTRSRPGTWTVYVDQAATYSKSTSPQLKYSFGSRARSAEPLSAIKDGSQREERHDERRERHDADLAAHDRQHDGALLGLGQRSDGLRVGQVAVLEHLLGRRDPQLLGDEADRDGQQRVEPVQLVGRAESPRRRARRRAAPGSPRRPGRPAAAATRPATVPPATSAARRTRPPRR